MLFFKHPVCIFILLFIPMGLCGQVTEEVEDHYLNQRYSETAINATGILQTIPLFTKTIDFRGVEPTFVFKWAMTPSKPRAFRLGLGGILSDDGDSKFFFSIGTEKTRQLSKRFYIYSGLDLFMHAQEDDSNGLLGLGILMGLKYDIAKQISIYTESKILLASNLDTGGAVLDFRPPTSVYIGYRFYRESKKKNKEKKKRRRNEK